MISVLLVDDREIERDRVRQVLETDPELRVVALSSTGSDALRLASAHGPDVVAIAWPGEAEESVSTAREIMVGFDRLSAPDAFETLLL